MNAVKPKRPDDQSAASIAALVLIPGMLNDRSIWDDVIAGVRRQLGDKVRVLVADVITQASIADMARDAWRLLAEIPAQTHCFVAGFSMGGYVALEMLSHPLRPIREAWLISTSGLPESPISAPLREKAIASFEQDFEKAIQATARWGTFEKEVDALEPVIEAMRKIGAEVAVRQTRAIMQRRDLREALGTLELPVHVLCGKEDRITPPSLSEELASSIPGAQLQWVEKSGHMLPFEQPAFIVQSLCARLVA